MVWDLLPGFVIVVIGTYVGSTMALRGLFGPSTTIREPDSRSATSGKRTTTWKDNSPASQEVKSACTR